MRATRSVFLACVISLVTSVAAMATPISYIHTGFGSGTLNGVAFGSLAPVAFTINATSDTSTVAVIPGAGWYNDNLSASITIAGVGTYNFTAATRFFSNTLQGIVGFSRAGLNGTDLFNGPLLAGWNMTTSVGPIAGSGQLLQWLGPAVLTSGGQLIFNNGVSDSTFQAIVGTAAVPEPGTFALFGIGVAGLAARALRKRTV